LILPGQNASASSDWQGKLVERTRLLLEQAWNLIDYLSLHWYVGNSANDFEAYMAVSELLEERLSAYEGLVRAVSLERRIKRPIYIAVDEWNVWYRTYPHEVRETTKLEEIYNLEDTLVTAMQLNAFIRHERTVKMANIAQIVNVIAPIYTRPDGLVLQTIFYPFELYSRTCGNLAIDTWWEGDTFSGGDYHGVRTLDVATTLDERKNQLVTYAVNRSQSSEIETEIQLVNVDFKGNINIYTINGPDIKAENTFETPNNVQIKETRITARDHTLDFKFEPHSVTALVYDIS
jgi:alpha-N-arabinofuranosidase